MSPDRQADAIRDLGLRILDEIRVPDAEAWLDVHDDAVGQVIVRRAPEDRYSGVIDQWPAYRLRGVAYPDQATIDMMVRHCCRLARGWLRRIATGGALPAWSYTTHSLIAGILREASLSLRLLESGSQPDHAHVMRFLCDEKNISMGDIKEAGGRIDVSEIVPPNGRFTMAGKGRPYIMVPNVDLPNTVVQSLQGRRLRDVIKDPCIDRAGPVKIASAELLDGNDGMLLLVLEDRQVPITAIPRGTDRRWLRMPFHPWT